MLYKQLYIIGNGFDIHHDIPSRYSDFCNWLKDNDFDLLERLHYFYRIDEEWWYQFEYKLGYPDMNDYIAKTASEAQPNYGSDDFRDRDYYVGQFVAEDEIGKLVFDIRVAFKSWIISLCAPNIDKKILIDKDAAFFITFNYTDTLQKLYNIPLSQILFIHGSVVAGTDLVLGHNRLSDDLNLEFSLKSPIPPDNLDEEELIEWYDMYCDDGEDFIYQSVREEVVSQICNLKKDTKSIIDVNRDIFESLSDVQTIYIYGFSFSLIDEPYLNEIVNRVDISITNWIVSYYSDRDKERAQSFFYKKGVKDIKVKYIKLSDLLLVKH